MAKVIVVAGLPGSGKSTYIRDNLSDIPGVDVADIYREHRERFPSYPITWEMAHSKLLRQVIQLTEDHSTVWVEGLFRPDSPSLHQLKDALKVKGVALEVIRLNASVEECFTRVVKQFNEGEISPEDTRARVRILRDIAGA